MYRNRDGRKQTHDCLLADTEAIVVERARKSQEEFLALEFGPVRHILVDAKNRSAFTVAVHFLGLIGRCFTAPEAEAALKTLALAARDLDETGFAAWLRKHSERA